MQILSTTSLTYIPLSQGPPSFQPPQSTTRPLLQTPTQPTFQPVQPTFQPIQPFLDEFLATAISSPKDRVVIAKLDNEVAKFMRDQRAKTLQFPAMVAYHRMIVHKIADYYAMEHVMVNVDEGQAVKLTKTDYSCIPEKRLSDMCESEAPSPGPPKPVKIMARRSPNLQQSPRSESERSSPSPSTPTSVLSAQAPAFTPPTEPSMSAQKAVGPKKLHLPPSAPPSEVIEREEEEEDESVVRDKEAAYQRARERIFAENQPQEEAEDVGPDLGNLLLSPKSDEDVFGKDIPRYVSPISAPSIPNPYPYPMNHPGMGVMPGGIWGPGSGHGGGGVWPSDSVGTAGTVVYGPGAVSHHPMAGMAYSHPPFNPGLQRHPFSGNIPEACNPAAGGGIWGGAYHHQHPPPFSAPPGSANMPTRPSHWPTSQPSPTSVSNNGDRFGIWSNGPSHSGGDGALRREGELTSANRERYGGPPQSRGDPSGMFGTHHGVYGHDGGDMEGRNSLQAPASGSILQVVPGQVPISRLDASLAPVKALGARIEYRGPGLVLAVFGSHQTAQRALATVRSPDFTLSMWGTGLI